MKKIFGLMIGTALAAALVTATPKDVNAAGMPCTETTIAQAQALKAQADQELAVAVAAKAQADANVVALQAAGVTGLELLQATDAATNAANVVAAYQGKVQNAQTFIDNIVSRGNTEQYYLDMETKWANRCSLDDVQNKLNGANSITSAAFSKVQVLQGELAKAIANAAANPGLAANVEISFKAAEIKNIYIPVSSLFTDSNGKSCVWVVENDTVSLRHVTVSAIQKNDLAVIVSGLQSNEIIVSAGVSYLHDGQKVKPVAQNSETNIGHIL